MDGSLVVSIIAIAISVGSLAWQITRERWQRPVVSVGGIRGSHQDSQMTEPHWEYRLDVTNVGERAVTLIDVGLIFDRQPGGYTSRGLAYDEVADFPIRLEAHDSRSWTFPGGPSSRPEPDYEPWVKVVQRPTWRERRRGTLPERTIVGRMFGSLGPELNGTLSSKLTRKQLRRREAARQSARAGRTGQPLI